MNFIAQLGSSLENVRAAEREKTCLTLRPEFMVFVSVGSLLTFLHPLSLSFIQVCVLPILTMHLSPLFRTVLFIFFNGSTCTIEARWMFYFSLSDFWNCFSPLLLSCSFLQFFLCVFVGIVSNSCRQIPFLSVLFFFFCFSEPFAHVFWCISYLGVIAELFTKWSVSFISGSSGQPIVATSGHRIYPTTEKDLEKLLNSR